MIKLHPKTFEAYKLFHQGVLALSRAEQQGIRVDLEYIETKKEHLTRKIARLEEQFKETNFFKHWEHAVRGKININSNSQLAHFLYDVKKIKVEQETDSGQGSTNDETLRQMNIPELETLLQMRKLKKIRDTYLDAFAREQVNGVIHPVFNLHLVRTFRSSSDSPNFQNIPKRDEEAMQMVRRALFPRPGHQLLEIDFSGLEVRIAACYHKDSTMLRYINNPASDMHADMAKQLFVIDKFDKSRPDHKVLRQAAKNGFVFPQFYGDYYKNCAVNMACSWGKLRQGTWKLGEGIPMNDGTLSDHLIEHGLVSLSKFTEHVRLIEADFWGKRFKDYADWKDRWYKVYKKYGYVDLLTGFRCSGIMSRNDCINYPVQGAAFHVNLKSLILLDNVLYDENFDTKIIGQIHDSIILDVLPSELDRVAVIAHKITCEEVPALWPWINVPLDVEMELCPVDASWTDKKKYSLK